jgi:serine/threonine protein kinase/WD40 repeat protein
MKPEDNEPLDDTLLALAASCDEALADGGAAGLEQAALVPEEYRSDLEGRIDCMRMLRQAWAGESGVAPGRVRPSRTPTDTGIEPSLSSSVTPATHIGRFEVRRELGRGGFGVVFLAHDPFLHRDVALKVPRTEAFLDPQLRVRLHREATTAAGLDHPNIVPIYEAGEAGPVCYIASAYCPGVTLAAWLKGQTAPVSFGDAATLTATLAEAVHYAHGQGVVHRDLKPANVLLQRDNRTSPSEEATPSPSASSAIANLQSAIPKITDFGLAKHLDDEKGPAQPLTRPGAILGTPEYMAPEQAGTAAGPLGPTTDVYALGVILYEMLASRPPFQGDSALDVLRQVETAEPVSPGRLRPKLPRDLETICLKCLQKEPRQRYSSALALAEDLERFVKGEPILARPVSQGEKLWRWCRRKPLVAALLASVSLLVLAVAIGTPLAAVMWQQQRDEARWQARRATNAEGDAREKLWQSYLDQAELRRSTKASGQRFQGLEVLREASRIRRSPAVRNAAIACLALTDAKISRQWPLPRQLADVVAFDALLERYAYKDRQFHISVRSAADNRELVALPGPPTPTWTMRIKFSPDGRYLAAVYEFPDASPNKVFAWDLSRGAKLFEKSTGSEGGLDFSPDSRSVALAGSDGSIGIFAIPGGEELLRLKKSCRVHSLVFDPTGRRLAVSSIEDKLVEIRDLDKAGRIAAKFAHPSGVHISAWRGDGLLLVSGCGDGNAYVWDVSANRQLVALTGHRNLVSFLAFNRAGDLLVSASWDNTTKLWDPVTGANLLTTQGYCWGFDRGEERLATIDTEFGIWQVASRRECRTLHFRSVGRPVPEVDKGGPWSVDFSSNGQLLVAAGEDGVRLWEMPSGRQVAHLPAGRCESALFLPGETTTLITYGHEGLLRWPIPHDHARLGDARPVLLRAATKSAKHRAALSQDGNTIAYLDFANEQTIVIDAKIPAKQVVLKGLPRENYVAVSPNGRWAAVGNWRAREGARVWDLTTGAQVWQLQPTDSQEMSCAVAFSPDGQWLVTSEQDKYRFWQVGSWAPGLVIPRDRLEPNPGPLAFSRDSRTLAIARSALTVQLIDEATGQEIATLSAPDPQPVSSLCFSPDGGLLAAATYSQVIQLWDLRLIRRELEEMNLDGDTSITAQH